MFDLFKLSLFHTDYYPIKNVKIFEYYVKIKNEVQVMVNTFFENYKLYDMMIFKKVLL